MSKNLSTSEINLVLKKIRVRYDELARNFKKSRAISDAFEDRYLNALKKRADISVFLMAEIEVVEELIKKEALKEKEKNKVKIVKEVLTPSFADKIIEENRKKIIKYQRIDLGSDADEEVERLLGAVRQLVNDYYPALNYVYKERRHTTEGERFNGIYHKLLSQYDYKDDVPISRQYFEALSRQPKDYKKIDFEHRFIMQETAFLLNDLFDSLEMIIKKNIVPLPDNKIILSANDKQNLNTMFYENFNQLTYTEGLMKIMNFVSNVLSDFRVKGIKKNYRI